MRESGEALIDSHRRAARAESARPRLRRRHDGAAGRPRGADVLGVDIAANLVAAGNERARAAGLTQHRFQEGDACNLERSATTVFDLVVTIFGAMFAPKPFDVAKEMVRVTKPGGRIVMGNWIPGDPTLVAQILKISAAYTPPPPEGFISPVTWGVEANVGERFGEAGVAPRRYRLSARPTRSTSPARRRRSSTDVPQLLRPDDECVRCRGEERQGRPICSANSRRCLKRRTRAAARTSRGFRRRSCA